MKIIAFITEPKTIRRILNAIGEDSEPPQLTQPRAPPEELDLISQETDFDYNQAPAGWWNMAKHGHPLPVCEKLKKKQ